MKKIILLILVSVYIFGWEINTHRAIDRQAILNGQAINLYTFLNNSYLGSQTFNDRYSIMFDGYGMTYFEYIKKGEKGGISKWNQTFSSNHYAIDLLEAGTILEDALWPTNIQPADGRFNNHFYDPQAGGKGLDIGISQFQNAIQWAQTGAFSDTSDYISLFSTQDNIYSLDLALEYFNLGFTSSQKDEQRRYQAKMLVSVGHIV